MESFLPSFTRLKEKCPDLYELVGDCLIVEVLPSEEATKDVRGADGAVKKLYLAGGEKKSVDGLDMNRPTFCRVLAVGNGYYDDKEEKIIPLEIEPGDIVLVGPMAIKRLSVFGPLVSAGDRQLAITRESEVQIRFKGAVGYNMSVDALKETVVEAPTA